MADVVLNAVSRSIEKINKDFLIKPKQFEAISSILNGFDTLAILPTSYGKSLIFQLLIPVCKLLPNRPKNPIIVVLSPLKSLIATQVADANRRSSIGLKAIDLAEATTKNILGDKINIICGTPERWLDQGGKNILKISEVRLNLVAVVIDEVHKVSWGIPSSSNSKAFREAFSRIGQIRTFCPERTPILALSATLDADLTELVKCSCELSKNLKIVHYCSNRDNIRLSIVKTSKSIKHLKWVLDSAKEYGELCPKVLIYCRSQATVGWLYSNFLNYLKDYAYKGNNKDEENCLVGIYPVENCFLGMYHADTLYSTEKNAML